MKWCVPKDVLSLAPAAICKNISVFNGHVFTFLLEGRNLTGANKLFFTSRIQRHFTLGQSNCYKVFILIRIHVKLGTIYFNFRTQIGNKKWSFAFFNLEICLASKLHTTFARVKNNGVGNSDPEFSHTFDPSANQQLYAHKKGRQQSDFGCAYFRAGSNIFELNFADCKTTIRK